MAGGAVIVWVFLVSSIQLNRIKLPGSLGDKCKDDKSPCPWGA